MRFLGGRLAALLCAAAGALLSGSPACAQSPTVFANAPIGQFTMPLRTIKQLRLERAFRTTIPQQFDYSCGSAAIATLLTYHYGQPKTEADVFRVMIEHADRDRVQREGFSLLDMKRYLESLGYAADGFEAGLDQLVEANVPAIVLIRENGYNHFVVVKGFAQGKVVLGDPAMGTRFLTRAHFESVWQGGLLFVIRSHLDVARFNRQEDWGSRLIAPLAQAVDRNSLGALTLTLPPPDAF
jgi:predicted double-glycine peptidase